MIDVCRGATVSSAGSALLGCMLLAGCAPLPARGGCAGDAHAAGAPPSVVYLQRSLARRIAVASLAAQTTAIATTHVVARFANCSDRDVELRVRTRFLDGGRAAAEPASPWHDVFIPRGGTSRYETYSLSTAAAHYTIELDAHR